MMYGQDYAARTQKQQSLEEGMGVKVENSRRERSNSNCQKHVAELTNG